MTGAKILVLLAALAMLLALPAMVLVDYTDDGSVAIQQPEQLVAAADQVNLEGAQLLAHFEPLGTNAVTGSATASPFSGMPSTGKASGGMGDSVSPLVLKCNSCRY